MDPPLNRSCSAVGDDLNLDLNLGLKSRRQLEPNPAPLPRPPILSLRNGPNSCPLLPPKLKPIVPPTTYPWATDRHASIYSMGYLLDNGIETISGTMRCNKCRAQSVVNYNLVEDFQNLLNFIKRRYQDFHDRAPPEWLSQKYRDCKTCGETWCVRPVVPENYSEINWLFLLLGENLGWCNLDQLKYFCQHTKNHRSGAKDRVLYLVYKSLCRQLDPTMQL